MAGMPGRIAKASVFRKIDVWANSDIPARAERGKLVLECETLVQVIERSQNLGLSAEEKAHVLEHWFNPSSGWWLPHQPIEPVVRRAYLHAFTHAAVARLPIDSYWICAGDRVEAYVTRSPAQVTVMLATPAPDDWGAGPFASPENIWVVRGGVKRGERFEHVTDEQVLTLRAYS